MTRLSRGHRHAVLHTVGQLAAMGVVCLAGLSACGGGGSTASAPTTPAPGPALPPSGVCGAIGVSASMAILSGTECPAGNSAVVLLNMRDRDDFAVGACSGTIIASRAILTAAHCIDGDTAVVRVWLGSGTERTAESFTPHPDYRSAGNSTADVGIVVMAEELGRVPIPLLISRDARVGEMAIIAGWGRDQNSVPATLRAGATTITAAGATLLETQFGANVSSVCSGDSGGPILLSEGGEWVMGGVTSATSANVCNTGTNYYVSLRNTSVSSFILSRVPQAVRR